MGNKSMIANKIKFPQLSLRILSLLAPADPQKLVDVANFIQLMKLPVPLLDEHLLIHEGKILSHNASPLVEDWGVPLGGHPVQGYQVLIQISLPD